MGPMARSHDELTSSAGERIGPRALPGEEEQGGLHGGGGPWFGWIEQGICHLVGLVLGGTDHISDCKTAWRKHGTREGSHNCFFSEDVAACACLGHTGSWAHSPIGATAQHWVGGQAGHALGTCLH